MRYKIAVINPVNREDYLGRTISDGLLCLKEKYPEIDFRVSQDYDSTIKTGKYVLSREEFIKFALNSDVIFLIWGKDFTDIDLANRINKFDKTVFIDGSEVGKNRRFDFGIQNDVLNLKYKNGGRIDTDMLNKCRFYFRREKPYKDGIIPFPFGIERAYRKYYSEKTLKDIDFFCVFGQDEYPTLRRYSKEIMVDFCKKNNFSYFAERTDKDNFYKMLARSKVGVSIGGGGYDTLRFWEILGNNCLLLTEKIDIYEPDSKRLEYGRIWQFSNLFDFEYQLNKLGEYLRDGYDQSNLSEEYQKIISEHSSLARVEEVLKAINPRYL